MKKVLALPFVIALFLFSPAQAQGPYVGTGLVYNNPLGNDIDYLDSGFGLDFRFGYDFGPVGLEVNLMGSRHNDTAPDFGRADFGGFSIDVRIFLSQWNDPDQFYLLAGIGAYTISEFYPGYGTDVDLNGSGLNLGAGVEHYLNTNLALNLGVVYRLIRYDEWEVNGIVYDIGPDLNGDILTFQAGIIYHF